MLGRAIDLVSDDQRVLAAIGCVFIYPFQQVLQDDIGRIATCVAGLLADHVHCPRDHADVLRCDGFNDIVENANSGANLDRAPGALRMEDLVPVEFHVPTKPVNAGSYSRDPVEVFATAAGPSVTNAAIVYQPLACDSSTYASSTNRAYCGHAGVPCQRHPTRPPRSLLPTRPS